MTSNVTTVMTTVVTTLAPSYNFSGNATAFNDTIDWQSLSRGMCTEKGGELFGTGCDTPFYKSDVFLLSILLFILTYKIASTLTAFKNSSFFPSFVSVIMLRYEEL